MILYPNTGSNSAKHAVSWKMLEMILQGDIVDVYGFMFLLLNIIIMLGCSLLNCLLTYFIING